MKPAPGKILDLLFRFVRTVIMLGFDSLVVLSSKRQSRRSEGAIFCLHGLGDLLLAGNAISGLSSFLHANNLRAVLFVNPALVEFARQHFPVDQVEGIDRHAFSRRLKHRKAILKTVAQRFAIAVQPTYNRMLRVEDCLMRATGASQRIGSAGHAPFITTQERWWSDRFYTRLITTPAEPMHELQRYVELLANMDLNISKDPWKLGDVNKLPEMMSVADKPYLVIAPNASQAKRSWPLKNFLIAGYQIAMRHHLNVVLIDEEKLPAPVSWPDEVRPQSANQPGLIDLCGQIPIQDIPTVIAAARLVICNDSGMMHLGASLDRPTIAVGGSGMPMRYFPYPEEARSSLKVIYKKVPCAGCDWKCIYNLSRNETAWCISQISWEDIVQGAQELMCSSESKQSLKNAERV